jgi:hypothetical protein
MGKHRAARPAMKKSLQAWIAIVVVVLLIAGGYAYYHFTDQAFMFDFSVPVSGHTEGAAFEFYAGPMLPMNAIGDSAGITAKRSMDFSFTPTDFGRQDMRVMDRYTLTNNTQKDKTIEVVYPFISSISSSARLTPALTLNGESLQPVLFAGDYTGGFQSMNFASINAWEGYRALLTDGGYFEKAQKGMDLPADPAVTVYTLDDIACPEEFYSATIDITFPLPEGSHVMTFGSHGTGYDKESASYCCKFSAGEEKDRDSRIIVLGQPPSKFTTQGYNEWHEKTDRITVSLKPETMPLSNAVHDCMAIIGARDPLPVSPLMTDEIAYFAVKSMFQYTYLGDRPETRYNPVWLDSLIKDAYSLERVMYLKAPVKIPAGQSIALESSLQKEGSSDFARMHRKENIGTYCYDMLTKLGSVLDFTAQKASIDLPQALKIIRQNFGFDPAKGITEVALDLNEERYYLEIGKTTPEK